MSATLLQQTITFLRGAFTPAQAATVQAYGGEFNAAEVGQLAFNCPALLVTVLGWAPDHTSERLAGRDVRGVRMACFVAYKHTNRTTRLQGAMLLAEMLCLRLKSWKPGALVGLPESLAPLEEEPGAENLYGRAMDAKGMALWLVRWQQAVKPVIPTGELYDLLAVEIEDTTRQGVVPAPAPGPSGLVVTEDVQFAELPPPAG
jgi:hypothetical protein